MKEADAIEAASRPEMTDASMIAAGLSEGARERILGDDDTDCPAGIAAQFARHRLIEPHPDDDNGWRWSILGLAVRAILQGDPS